MSVRPLDGYRVLDLAQNSAGQQDHHRAQPAGGLSAVGAAPFATSPSGVFRAGDGHVVLAAYVPKHWALLTALLDREDLATDQRFSDQRARGRHDAELVEELEKSFASYRPADLVARLRGAGFMAAEVSTWSEVVAPPLFAENSLACVVSDGERTETTVRTPARYSGFRPVAMSPTPALGEFDIED